MDLDAVAPVGGGSEPVVSDGTSEGCVSKADMNQAETDFDTASEQYTILKVTGPWPVLHYIVLNPDDTEEELFHYTIDILNEVVCQVEEIFNWLPFVFASLWLFLTPIISKLLEDFIEQYLLYNFVLGSWLLLDYLKLCDISGTVFTATLVTASLATVGWIALICSIAELTSALFGYAFGVVVWLIVLIEVLKSLSAIRTGGLAETGIAAQIITMSQLVSAAFGPFDVVNLLLLWVDWATIAFLLGMFALSIVGIGYYLVLNFTT